MREEINTNTKGDSDVKTVNVFDVSQADVVRSGKGEWDDFELLGESNSGEREYKAKEENSERIAAALERARSAAIGKKILKLNLAAM